LSLVFVVFLLGGLYLIVVFLEEVVGEVELVVDGIFPGVVLEEFISHLLGDGGVVLLLFGAGLGGLVLESGGGVGKEGVALLDLSENLGGVELFG
jgi:hypothetical protein